MTDHRTGPSNAFIIDLVHTYWLLIFQLGDFDITREEAQQALCNSKEDGQKMKAFKAAMERSLPQQICAVLTGVMEQADNVRKLLVL